MPVNLFLFFSCRPRSYICSDQQSSYICSYNVNNPILFISWIYTADGEYSVKSGYYILRTHFALDVHDLVTQSSHANDQLDLF